MATFAQDNYSDGAAVLLENHTPDIGGGNTLHGSYTSGMYVNTNRLLPSASAGVGLVYNNGVPASADVDGQIVIKCGGVNPGSGTAYGICLRVATAADTFYLFTLIGGTGWQVYQRVTGSFTQIGSTTATPDLVSDNTNHTIFFSVTGAAPETIVTKVDTVAKCGSPNTNTAISAAGKAGVRLSDTAQNCQMNSFICTSTGGVAALYRFRALLGVGL